MLTREKAIEEHRKMWHWLAENPDGVKEIYLLERYGLIALHNNCFLCQYAQESSDTVLGMCDYCPLEWPGDKCTEGGMYVDWINARARYDFEEAAKIALQIAELPEVKE